MSWTKSGYAMFMGVLLGTVMAACQPSSPNQSGSSQVQGKKQDATPRTDTTRWQEPSSNTPTLHLEQLPNPHMDSGPQLLYVQLQQLSPKAVA